MHAAESGAAVVCCLLLAGLPQSAEGHGYIRSPFSRAFGCMEGVNINCGPIMYEPQSVEGPDRYPETGPADGTIAGAGNPKWAPLNAQTATRWAKNEVSSGPLSITWFFQANHATRDFRYFITKVGWDTNSPLARASFEAEPFCSFDGMMQQPPITLVHACVAPPRSGYHIILGVWDVGDTANTFYNAVDCNFDGATAPPVPTPPPVVTPPTAPPPSCAIWQACGGTPACCPAGTQCFQQSVHYSQCRPACPVGWDCDGNGQPDSPSAAPQAQQNPPTPPPPTPGTCLVWEACRETPSCCPAGTQCYRQDQWYSQCRPSCPPAGWECS